MSVGDEKELERALLDDRMKPFKAEIDAQLVGFRGHKNGLLFHLRDAYNGGTKAEPFDEGGSWTRIETTAYQYFALQILKETVISNDREARYRAISEASQHARHKINDARWPDLAGNLMKAWLEGTKDLDDATKQLSDLLYNGLEFHRKVEKVVESLADLEVAATQAAANEVRKGRGRPKGTSDLPWNYIYALGWDYRKSTGLKPGRGDGPFAKFVREFLAAIGKRDEVSEDYAVDVIKNAPAQARGNAGKTIPSPFEQ